MVTGEREERGEVKGKRRRRKWKRLPHWREWWSNNSGLAHFWGLVPWPLALSILCTSFNPHHSPVWLQSSCFCSSLPAPTHFCLVEFLRWTDQVSCKMRPWRFRDMACREWHSRASLLVEEHQMKRIFALETLVLFGGDVSRYKAVVTPKTGFSLFLVTIAKNLVYCLGK